MNWLRVLIGMILWTTPAALVVAAVASRDLQRRVLPVFVLLILLMTGQRCTGIGRAAKRNR